MKKVQKNNILLNKYILAVFILLLLVIAFFAIANKRGNKINETIPSTPGGAGRINLDPPTDAEKQATEQHKQELINKSQQQSQPPVTGQKKQVKPVITYAEQFNDAIEVAAFMPDIYESGGTCSLTATQGSQTINRQVPALKDARTTVCQNFAIQRSDFYSGGNWNIQVGYSSSTAQGTSESKTVEVR